MSVWNILHMEPTQDSKQIKKAYAKQLKLNHPEENPQGYQQLREAYSAALEYSKHPSDDTMEQKVLAIDIPSIETDKRNVRDYNSYGNHSNGQADFEQINFEQTDFEQTDIDQVDRNQAEYYSYEESVITPTYIIKFDEFMEQVRNLYHNPDTYKDIKCWNKLMNVDIIWKLEYRELLGYRMKDFLMEHYLLPKEVWELLDSYFYLSDMDEILFAFVKQNLYMAVRSGKIKAVKGVLENGVDLEVMGSRGKTAIRYAVEHGYCDIVLQLLKHNVNLEAKDSEGRTALIDAIKADRPELVKTLLDYGANGNTADNNGKTALMYAVQSDDITAAELLLERGVDLEASDSINGKTALRYAVISKKEKNVELLLMKGAKVEPKNKGAVSLFIIAVRSGDVAIMELLRKNGEDINQVNEDGISALAAAVEYNPTSVEYLIQQGANLEAKSDKSNVLKIAINKNKVEALQYLIQGGVDIKTWRSGEMNSLMFAAFCGHAEIVKCLLDNGVPVNESTFDSAYVRECSALFYAAICGKESAVRLLLEYGAEDTCLNIIYSSSAGLLHRVKYLVEIEKADINEVDKKDGSTALIWAIKNEKLEVIQYLIEHGAFVNIKYKNISSPLIEAALVRNTEIMDLLIAYGADIELKTGEGFTVLFRCAEEANMYSMEYLVEKGADIEAVDICGHTPLMAATMNKKLYSVKYLIEKGADINKYDKAGNNAMVHAIRVNQANIVYLLMKNGADINFIDKKGRTYLQLAAVFGHLNLVKYFLKNGMSLNDRSNDGNTILLDAAENNHINIVRYIMTEEQGVNINAKNNEGKTAFDIAVKNDNGEMKELLENIILRERV